MIFSEVLRGAARQPDMDGGGDTFAVEAARGGAEDPRREVRRAAPVDDHGSLAAVRQVEAAGPEGGDETRPVVARPPGRQRRAADVVAGGRNAPRARSPAIRAAGMPSSSVGVRSIVSVEDAGCEGDGVASDWRDGPRSRPQVRDGSYVGTAPPASA